MTKSHDALDPPLEKSKKQEKEENDNNSALLSVYNVVLLPSFIQQVVQAGTSIKKLLNLTLAEAVEKDDKTRLIAGHDATQTAPRQGFFILMSSINQKQKIFTKKKDFRCLDATKLPHQRSSVCLMDITRPVKRRKYSWNIQKTIASRNRDDPS